MNQVPDNFGVLLNHLFPPLKIVVPNDLLQSWFPTENQKGIIDKKSKAAAEAYAARHGCVFHYFPIGGDCEQGEGHFLRA